MILTKDRLQSLTAQFGQLKVGLIGDLFLDRYLHLDGNLTESSIETGLDAYQVVEVRNSPGALGTVISNLLALGCCHLHPVTVIGTDGHATDLLVELQSPSIQLQDVVQAADRLTPTYTKPMLAQSGTESELNRLDIRSRQPLSHQQTRDLCQRIVQRFNQVDGWIVLDQVNETDWGVVNSAVRAQLATLAQQHPQKLVVIDSRQHLGEFTSGVLKGNAAECTSAAETQSPADAVEQLAGRTGQVAFCTDGKIGIRFAQPGHAAQHAPAVSVAGPIDIVGAGDAATSAISLALLAGASAEEAAELANLAASVTVQKLGTTGTASPEEVLAQLERAHLTTGRKP